MTAVTTEHRFETDDRIYLTRWCDDIHRAMELEAEYRNRGADFSAYRPGGCLGKFRVIGHFRKEQP